ncbi:Diguanylate cyclase/phosphodiesterase with PAS/PAC sensor(S) [Candidatus Sulfotelmatomonas gaucii]|uniref:Diguanylate cyclase/phosphodiesterase with PAS/PAC sensor(S) n=1 Tax=Candidatus Sulfuritelmatomonas gaucii TaxID=2043161 RepID=A0A2N9M324_9BACT|nr:Diguanylate cyclase/phosphodiesterase with PAS/PAC sensor(S) [Candidatus Sulfotelmatomonas gaucii]
MLNRAAANLEALIESTDDLIGAVDLDFRLITFNQALSKTIARNRRTQVALGKRMEDLLPPELATLLNSHFQQALAEGPFQATLTTLDGRVIEFAYNPIIAGGKKAGVSVFGKDITERSHAVANLSALIESKADFIWSVDRNYRLITFNGELKRTFEASFGITPVAGMLPGDLLPPERAAIFPPLYERAVADGPFRFEYTTLDGRTVEMALNPIVVGGEKTGVSVFGKDVTERKAAERALLEAEKKYREIFDGALEGIFQTSPDGRLLTANPALVQMLGYDVQDYAAAMGTDIVPDVWVDPAERSMYLRLLEEKKVLRGYECRFRRKDGAVIWVSLNARATFAADGTTTINEGFIEDITERKRTEMQLSASETRYRAVFQASLDGMAISRQNDNRYIEVNQAFLDIMGFEREEVVGRTALELGFWVHPDHRQRLVDMLRRDSSFRDEETEFRRKNGEIVWVRLSVSLIEIDGLSCVLTVMRDISVARAAALQLASAQEALRTSEGRYRTVFQTSLDPVCITRLSDGSIIDANRAFLEAMGFARDEVIGHSTLQLGIWADQHERQDMVRTLQEHSAFREIQARFRKKSGEIFWVMLSASVIEIEGTTCLLGVFRDLSDAKAAEERIKDLAFYDQLTRLPNRRLLLERVKTAQGRGRAPSSDRAMLLLDLGEFKKLNDSRGHQTGDLLLREVARRLTSCVRGTDTVARCGGDEFAVLLENLGKIPEPAATHAQFVAGKIVDALSQPYSLAGQECYCHCSIGIAVFGNEQGTPHQVLQQAELALDQAKIEGRNAVRFFAPDLQHTADVRAAIEQDLHHAINKKQFVLYYQPQVDSTGLIGVESLIRWNHPQRGLLAPDEFINLAEETELILPLGEWVLEAACTQIAAWVQRKQPVHLALAVNISARQFRSPEFVDQVLAVLHRTGANPQNLKLELTESMLLEDVEGVIARMSVLKSHGLRFSLDDFGTGYSSLSYLKRLPLDQLKIDRAFVRDILGDVTSGAIAQTIISLSRAMGLSVIAEGVETEEQRDFLARLGCDAFQGYLFGHPLPIEEFERTWLSR